MVEILQEAYRRGLSVERHHRTGEYMIDGARWDIWDRLKDEPNRRFVGTQLVKDYN